MAKNKSKSSTTTTTTTTTVNPVAAFKDHNFELLVEMMGEELAKGLYLKGQKLEKHECAEDGSCYHLHNPRFAQIFISAQANFEAEWAKPVDERDLRTAAASPLFNGIAYGTYKAKNGHKNGYVWYRAEREEIDEDGKYTGELETQWRLKRVEHGEDLGKDRSKYKKAQSHHGFESDCWIDHRGWKPNLWQFNHFYYLIPLTPEEQKEGITERIRIKAWDFLQGSDLDLLEKDVGFYILKKEQEKLEQEEAQEKEKEAAIAAEKARLAEDLRVAKLAHAAAEQERKMKKERKKKARQVLESIDSQFQALVTGVTDMHVGIKKSGTPEYRKYCEAIKTKKVDPRTALWLRRRHDFKDYVLSNWQDQYIENGDIFKSLVVLTNKFMPKNMWDILSIKPGVFVKEIIDAVQVSNDKD